MECSYASGQESFIMSFSKSSLFLVATLASASIVLPSCSSETTSSESAAMGELGLNLVVDGVTINSIDYVISLDGKTVLDGSMDVSDQDKAALRVGGLAEKTGYSLVMTAKTTDGDDCNGSASFDVTAGTFNTVPVTLTCLVGGGTGEGPVGGVEVDGTVEVKDNGSGQSCSGAFVVASPFTAEVNGKIKLSSSAVTGATGLSYSWTANGSEFATAQNAEYECKAAGTVKIALTATGDKCTLVRELEVSCTGDVAPRCGDGVVNQPSEECDDGEAGSATCSTDCKKIGPVCGNGTKEGDEECDDGNDSNEDSCTNECKEARCGDGFKQGSEECDDGNTVDDDDCSNSCVAKVVKPTVSWTDGKSPECEQCMEDKCKKQQDACFGDEACVAAKQCHADNTCLSRKIGPLSCLCGKGVSVAECTAGTSFAGDCAEEIQTGLGTTDVQTTIAKFLDQGTAIGVANGAYVCMARKCRNVCGVLIFD